MATLKSDSSSGDLNFRAQLLEIRDSKRMEERIFSRSIGIFLKIEQSGKRRPNEAI